MNNTNENNYIEAVIYLKNGNRKYGMLIENMIKDAYHFISNNNYNLFKKDNNNSHIEVVPNILIESIDTNIK